MALFGQTAREFKKQNPKFKGKIINQIQVNSVSYEIPFDDTMPSSKKIKRAVEEALYNSTSNKTMLKNLFFNISLRIINKFTIVKLKKSIQCSQLTM